MTSVFVTMDNGQVITGACVSFTVTRNEHVLVSPAPSVALNIIIVIPFGKIAPFGRPLWSMILGNGEVQLSVAVGGG